MSLSKELEESNYIVIDEIENKNSLEDEYKNKIQKKVELKEKIEQDLEKINEFIKMYSSEKEKILIDLEKISLEEKDGIKYQFDFENQSDRDFKKFINDFNQCEELREIFKHVRDKRAYKLIDEYTRKTNDGLRLKETEQNELNELKDLVERQNMAFKKLATEIIKEEGKEAKYKIDFKPIFDDKKKEMEENLQLLISSLNKVGLDDYVQKMLNMIESLLTVEGEIDLIEKNSLLNKAWNLGDLATLEKIVIENENYKEVIEIANQVDQNIKENKSSLFITSISSVVGKGNLISILEEKGHKIVQQKPQIEDVTGIFYRIFSPEGAELGYLLGTVHCANKEMLKLNNSIHQALKASKSLYIEVSPKIDSNTSSEEIEQIFLRWSEEAQSILKKEIKIKTEEEEKKWKSFVLEAFPILCDEYKKIGIPVSSIEEICKLYQSLSFEKQRELVQSMISELKLKEAEIVMDEGGSTPVGIEAIIILHGLKEGKNLDGLEKSTREKDFEKESLEAEINQLPQLNEVKNHLEKQLKNVKEICDHWIEGDDDYFIEVNNEFKKNYSELYQKIMTNRNNQMANKIHNIFIECKEKKEKPFFAIGTGHLFGNDSVNKLLTEMGYFLKRA